MNNLLKAPITETAYVPPLYAHNQLSSVEETLIDENYQLSTQSKKDEMLTSSC